jgi:hypothetical protein
MRRVVLVAIGGRTLALLVLHTPGPPAWQRDPAIEIGNTYAAASIPEASASDYRTIS